MSGVLKARVGGAWVDVTSGANIHVGPTVPISSEELWYDTDEVSTPVLAAQAIATQAGTAYTLVYNDRYKMIIFSAATAITLTIPTYANVAYPLGTWMEIAQVGAGKLTVAGPGTNITVTPTPILRTLGSAARLLNIGTDTWLATGDFGG